MVEEKGHPNGIDEQPATDAKPKAGEDLDHRVSRRKLLVTGVGVMSGAIAATVGVPAIFYVAGPAQEQGGEQDWIRLGTASSIETGTQTLMKATVERRAGYLTTTEELSVFVSTENGADFVALSNICTHLGCRVRWVDDQNAFFCPCHNAVFGPDGTVLEGPPPRPLDRFETKVEDGQIFIRRT
ncbi:MAG: ubiquinol-cytochrome c reductase iron-sulfur subunit [Acidimicrobiia bacterium]|nr:ubiquinol-cytochrome c reductase iron-sulfur subunit [Acidimicrobiia bacterium]MDH3396687.1 ubiquinol-cytochrome c reductase iron-sulfur subunit [Acidimicrobiia bacterium]MDH5615967.1 ubiquinol-cytochrome c reductase iron-sulfur subunit [Acidimicrobiia bacterium]